MSITRPEDLGSGEVFHEECDFTQEQLQTNPERALYWLIKFESGEVECEPDISDNLHILIPAAFENLIQTKPEIAFMIAAQIVEALDHDKSAFSQTLNILASYWSKFESEQPLKAGFVRFSMLDRVSSGNKKKILELAIAPAVDMQ